MLSIFEVVDLKKKCVSKNQYEQKNFFIKTTSRKKAIHINNLQKK
jgi:hypothetical protein